MADTEKATPSAASSLFDLRTVIAVLFAFYGIVLTIMGIISASPQDNAKSGGINLNLWTGIAMLVLAVLFVVWARMKPLAAGAPPPDATDDRPAHH
jgi:quinol-cytochrome oxidoreductase complex cytochrome b subunit